MINEIDIKDWQMLTEPLTISNLVTNDVFSIQDETEKLFKHIGYVNNSIVAVLIGDNVSPTYVFPDFMKVFHWKPQQETKVNPTSN